MNKSNPEQQELFDLPLDEQDALIEEIISTEDDKVNEETADESVVSDSSAVIETTVLDDYFDDDQEFLKAEDKIIEKRDDFALIQQLDGVMSWELLNFYDENGKPRHRFNLKNDPPILRFNSSDGQYAEFVLTKDVSSSLSKALEDVYRGYFGVRPKKTDEEPETFTGAFESMIAWVSDHRVSVTITTVIAFAMLLFLIVF